MQILFSFSSFRNYIEQSSHKNQVVSLIVGLREVKRSITSVMKTCAQNLGLSSYLFGNAFQILIKAYYRFKRSS